MSNSCGLICDLLPLYCDGVCCEDSAAAVREHLESCQACRDLYAVMQQELPAADAAYEQRQTASLKAVKQKAKRRNTVFAAVGMAAGILLAAVLTWIMLLAGVIVFAVRDGEKDRYTSANITEYGVFEGFRGYSKLDIFPKELTGEAQAYSYSYTDTFLDPTAEIYLECRYDTEEYRAEVERLKGLQETYRDRTQTAVYDTDSFLFPAYVTIDAHDHCYEYALLLDEERIAYIFLQFMEEENITFPTEYLPRDYEGRGGGYSIYAFPLENGDEYCVY